MQSNINWFLMLIKWPVAILMILMILPAVKTIGVVSLNLVNSHILLWFGLPFIIACAAWLFMPAMGGSFLAIMEHELTHMLFALLTFHKPVDLDVHQNKGGYFKFQGKGNWLIALAPYFFPTFPAVIMIASLIYKLMGQPVPDVYLSVFGFMVGYHLASTILEIHPAQTDFKTAGYIFTILFLPGVNLIVYGLLLSFACIGWQGLPLFMNGLFYHTQQFINQVVFPG